MIDLFEKEYNYAKEPIEHLEAVRFNVFLISFDRVNESDRKLEKEWTGLKLNQITDRSWYFRRVAAKRQLEFPRRVFCFMQSRTVLKDEAEKIAVKQIKDRIVNAKGKITSWTNRMEEIRSGWNSLFPIEDDPKYIQAIETIKAKQDHIASLEFQLRQLEPA